MKLSDVQKLVDAGYLTIEQQERIVAQFDLREEGSRFLAIISTIGAVMVGAGLVLMVAANWDEIPRLMKVVCGVLLMVGAHAGGWYLRESSHRYPKTGDALHLLAALLFLGNIALVGQVYHLPGRPPDAILLWWIGIVGFPWLLRSRALHILSLLAFGTWVLMEGFQNTRWFGIGESEWILLLPALLGLIYYGAGYFFFRTRYDLFAGPTQKLGLFAFHLFSFPMTWRFLFDDHDRQGLPVFLAMYAAAAILVVLGAQRERRLTPQWRWTWAVSLAGAGLVLVGALLEAPVVNSGYGGGSFYHWVISLGLFVLCLIQLQVAILIRSPYYLNLGITFVALHIISIYLNLIGTMAQTGLMFVISGVFLLVFGVYLEKKRRALMKHIRLAPEAPAP